MKTVSLLIATLALTISGYAQSPVTAESRFFVDGTSTLHDWTVESNHPGVRIWFARMNDAALPVIDSVSIRLPSTSLKSGKGGMDKKVYEALKTETHKDIVFSGQSIVATGPNSYKVSGKLTICGVSKQVNFPVQATNQQGRWVFSGSTAFDMSSYSVTPPVALMGTIKTGDRITIRFEVTSAGGGAANLRP